MLGSVYKIIAKLLAERLKRVMGKLVAGNQNAFIKSRQISDAALVANECVDYLNRKGIKEVVCKSDLEKAYDHVNWECLLNILKVMNFGERWIKWIKTCISTVKFSVLVNGNPVGVFSSQRGLRQGIPSPLIFLSW